MPQMRIHVYIRIHIRYLFLCIAMSRSTILVEQTTREKLKKIARKDQTYDDLLNQLIEMKTRESLNGGINHEPR
jgi:hypothetical protein